MNAMSYRYAKIKRNYCFCKLISVSLLKHWNYWDETNLKQGEKKIED